MLAERADYLITLSDRRLAEAQALVNRQYATLIFPTAKTAVSAANLKANASLSLNPQDSVLAGILTESGVLLGFFTSGRYLYGMFQGSVKPNKVTWLIFGIAPLNGASAMLTEGFSWSVIPVITAGLWALVIFMASLFVPQAYWQTKPFDYVCVCGGLSVLAIVLWQMTAIPLIAVAILILTEFTWISAGFPIYLATFSAVMVWLCVRNDKASIQ